jgi:CRISPR-associated protein (TIGR03986 family)
MLPIHKNPKTCCATAPYNFVPLPENVVNASSIPDHDSYSNNSGFIECNLKTLSPIYTRCGMSPDFFRENSDTKFHDLSESDKIERSEFYYTEDINKPVIPGSSIRGMVRNLVEVVGYGKIQNVFDKRLIFRAVGDNSSLGDYYRNKFLGPKQTLNSKWWFNYPLKNVQGGYLKRNNSKWWIQPARKINNESFVHVEYSAVNILGRDQKKQDTANDIVDVFIKPPKNRTTPPRTSQNLELCLAIVGSSSDIIIANNLQKQNGFEKAKLVQSGHMRGKHMHCAIYEPHNIEHNDNWIEIPNMLWDIYKEDCNMQRGFPTRIIEDGDPLFYLTDDKGNLVFFGSTMMFRVPYDTSIKKFIPKMLRENEELDFADAIFGFVDDKTKKSSAGRVFFSDAKCDSLEGDIWLKEKPIPIILASPKPTTFQHYLVQDSANRHNPDNKNQLAHYNTPSPKETVIRGFKFYWHKKEVKYEDPVKIDKSSKLYTLIKPIKDGVTFNFRINFDNLRDCELGALLWVLKLPSDNYCHTLGMGKPLGMGAVKITPKLSLYKREERYKRLFESSEDKWELAMNEESSIRNYLDKFETEVLEHLPSSEKGTAKNLENVQRIKMLLKMLEWPGPQIERTRYLKIEPNEYKNRPVLPDPLNIGEYLDRPRR